MLRPKTTVEVGNEVLHAEDDKLNRFVNVDAIGFQRRARESVARWCSRSQSSG